MKKDKIEVVEPKEKKIKAKPLHKKVVIIWGYGFWCGLFGMLGAVQLFFGNWVVGVLSLLLALGFIPSRMKKQEGL